MRVSRTRSWRVGTIALAAVGGRFVSGGAAFVGGYTVAKPELEAALSDERKPLNRQQRDEVITFLTWMRDNLYGEAWQSKPDPASENSSNAVALRDGKYLGMPLPTPICRVEHDAVGAGASSIGTRVGQLRQENGVWVCRFEFYIADSGHTFANDGGQVPEVLDLAP